MGTAVCCPHGPRAPRLLASWAVTMPEPNITAEATLPRE
jgi:hypothetical protein